jgi:aspartate kinase
MAQKLIIVKYGGSVLEDGTAFRKAAEAVKKEHNSGVKVIVVVSALKGVTDRLFAAAEAISPETSRSVIDHIIGLGEEQSVRLMTSALKTIGVDAVEVTPDSPSWPIVTDENYGDAEPIFEECESGAELGVRPLLERGRIPVVCGFVGRSPSGNITTLGRGGSDTTAVILARCLRADELVLVKDVGGVCSADPKKVEGAKTLETLSAWEANLLASSGANVLHDKIFRYKPDDLRIRIVSKDDSLNGSGTVISGFVPELEVKVHGNPVTNITVLGDLISDPDTISQILNAVIKRGGNVLSVKIDREISTLFVDGPPVELLPAVHSIIDSTEQLKVLSGSDDLALIDIRGRKLDDLSKAMQRIDEKLFSEGVFVKGRFTGQSSLRILVNWERRFQVAKFAEETLGRL